VSYRNAVIENKRVISCTQRDSVCVSVNLPCLFKDLANSHQAFKTLRTRLQAAQASNDLAQMHAILDDVHRPLAAMQHDMAECLDMMRMMPTGHGGMGKPEQKH
jgi:hypothetical protein